MIQRYMTTHKGKILVIRHHEKLLALLLRDNQILWDIFTWGRCRAFLRI